MFKATRETEKKPQPVKPEEEVIRLNKELAAATIKQEEQANRLKLMEEDNIAFQDFILSKIGGN